VAGPASADATGTDTLEDELNALLAKMSAPPVATASAAWPMTTPVARPEPVVQPPAAAEAALGDDDLNAALVADLRAMDLSDAYEPDEPVADDAPAEPSWLAAEPDGDASPVLPAASQVQPPAPEIETVEVPERVVAI